MNKQDFLEASLKAFTRYYNVKTEDVQAPFCAEAEFISHNEQYVLLKSAKIADIDSNEFIYFALSGKLTKEELSSLDTTAWERGLSKIHPGPGHRNSDVTLIIIADSIEADAFKSVKKCRHSKSYKMTFWGYSHYKLVAIDLSLGRLTTNYQGETLKKLFNNILKKFN